MTKNLYEPQWSEYLKQFDIPSSHFQNIPAMTHKYCVIVEPRKMDIFPLVVKNFMYLLQNKGWGLIIFHGTRNGEFIKSHLENIPNIVFENLGLENLTIQQYNHLLVHPPFWNFLVAQGCKHALIFQTDTLLLKDNIDDFLEYDYIGAPWKQEWVRGLTVGNGGLSLRNVDVMLRIIHTMGYNRVYDLYKRNGGILNTGGFNEDIFFSYASSFITKIPTVEIARQFSVETIFYDDPCGLHKPEAEIFKVQMWGNKNLVETQSRLAVENVMCDIIKKIERSNV